MKINNWEKIIEKVLEKEDLLFNGKGYPLCSAQAIKNYIKSQKELSYNQGAEEARAYYYKRVRREAIKETLDEIKNIQQDFLARETDIGWSKIQELHEEIDQELKKSISYKKYNK